MKVQGYARCADSSDASKARHDMRGWCRDRGHELHAFSWDAKSGMRGIRQAIGALAPGKCEVLLLRDLADIGRDLVGLVKTLRALLTIGTTVEVHTTPWPLTIKPIDQTEPWSSGTLVAALLTAHSGYVSEARRHGVATARANGAQIGRPRGITLADVQESLRRLMNANKGDMPSVRKVAAALTAAGMKCSTGTAAKLIKQFNAASAEAKEKGQGDGEG